MRDLDNRLEIEQSRRRLIEALGTIGVAGVAGCLGDDGGDGDDASGLDPDETPTEEDDDDNASGGDSDETPTDESASLVDDALTFHTEPAGSYIGEIGFNPYNPDTKATNAMLFAVEVFHDHNTQTGEFEPRLLADYALDGTSIDATLSDEFSWDNGEPVTAEDIVAHYKLDQVMGMGRVQDVAEVELVSDTEFHIELENQINPDIIGNSVLAGSGRIMRSVFEDFVERAEDATSDDERDEIAQDLREFNWELEDFHASGPFTVSRITEQQIEMEKNEHHPVADDLNFDKAEITNIQSNDTLQSMVQSARLDMAWGRWGQSFVQGLPEELDVWYREQPGGNGWFFNLDDEIIGQREVRKAFAHIIDREECVAGADSNNQPVQRITGMPNGTSELWLDDDFRENTLTDYSGKNFEEAERLLEEAGFEEDSDTWVTPDGEDWRVQVMNPSGDTVRIRESTIAVEHLNEFGIDAEIEVVEGGAHWDSIHELDYSVAMGFYAQRGDPHPYGDFKNVYFGEDFDLTVGIGENWMGQEDVVEAPPVGEPDGGLQEFEQRELITELGRVQDDDRASELVETLAWIYNQECWGLPIDVSTMPCPIREEAWDVPDGEEYMKQTVGLPFGRLVRRGEIQGKTE